MIRLTILTGPLSGTVSSFGREPVRIGRSSRSELCFGGAAHAVVSTHHAQIVYERGRYHVVDMGSSNGTFLNGKRVGEKRALASGDRLGFGQPGGPECGVLIDDSVAGPEPEGGYDRTVAMEPRVDADADAGGGKVYDAQEDAQRMAQHLQRGFADTEAMDMANAAAQQVAERRAQAGGQSSGDTVILLAEAMGKAHHSARERTSSRWRKLLAGVGGVALAVIAVLAVVVFVQQRELDSLVETKAGIDRQIQALEERMQAETDPARLAALQETLQTLTGSAQNTLRELRLRDEARAAELAAGGDPLEREIRQILAKFNASTYAIPPIFRERLQFHIGELSNVVNLRVMVQRQPRYWPTILKEFAALGLPEEMAHIAWVESGFDPEARSPAGALGLWQMTTTTAQSLGLTVADGVDERLDAQKQTRAAAQYLARLLSEFGEDSFMLVLASYNRGENGVRRALRQVAQEQGGFRKDKRDFWHLYRLKLLPEETREYVPRVLAAAIVAQRVMRGELRVP